MKPKKLNICGKIYDIQWLKDRRLVHADGDAYGSCDYELNLIKVWDNGRKDDMFEWLLHESTHAISGELGLDIDETRVNLLAAGMADFLTRNKIVDLERK